MSYVRKSPTQELDWHCMVIHQCVRHVPGRYCVRVWYKASDSVRLFTGFDYIRGMANSLPIMA